MISQQIKIKILALKATPFTLMNGYLYKLGTDDILRRCTLEHEREDIINEAHMLALWEVIFKLTRQPGRSFRVASGG
jgi:hypothetical protein